MHQPVRKTTARSHSDQNLVASFTDVRPAAPKVEPASPSSIDLPAAIRKRPLFAVAAFVLTLLAGAPFVLKQAPREYHAEVTIYVSPTYFKNLQNDREQLQISYSTLVNQQILTIRRHDILSEALKRLDAEGIHWRNPGEVEEAAVARLTEQLDIQHIPDSYEILVGLNGVKRDWLAPIVNTIASTYLEKRKREELADRSEGLGALMGEQANIETELQQKLDQQSKLSQQLMMVNLDKSVPVDDTLLAAARQAREDARRKRLEAEAQLSVMETSAAGAGKNPLKAAAEETIANDSGLRQSMSSLLQRSLDLKARIEAQEQRGLTPAHPLRQATEKELADVNEQLARIPQGVAEDASGRLLAKLHGDVDRSRLLEAQLDREVQAGTSKVQGLAKEVQQAQGLSGEIERLRRNQSTINSRIDELTMQDTAPGYLRIFSAAQTPIEPNKSNSKKILALLLGLALFLAIAVPVIMDLVDQRIHSPYEVARAVGFPPVGIILERTHGTQAFAEEHFRRLVNGIQRGVAAQDAKSIVLTPLKHARTPCSMVTDIGRTLLARGLKTVIVDANPRRADERVSANLTDLLTLGDPVTALQNADSLMPARIEIGSMKELSLVPVVARIGTMLEELKREYDVVLIDAPPLRLSADTEYLASIADITLVVVETGEATRRELIHGTSLLGRIGAPSIGVIMSQVRLSQAGTALKRDFKRFSSLSWSIASEGI